MGDGGDDISQSPYEMGLQELHTFMLLSAAQQETGTDGPVLPACTNNPDLCVKFEEAADLIGKDPKMNMAFTRYIDSRDTDDPFSAEQVRRVFSQRPSGSRVNTLLEDIGKYAQEALDTRIRAYGEYVPTPTPISDSNPPLILPKNQFNQASEATPATDWDAVIKAAAEEFMQKRGGASRTLHEAALLPIDDCPYESTMIPDVPSDDTTSPPLDPGLPHLLALITHTPKSNWAISEDGKYVVGEVQVSDALQHMALDKALSSDLEASPLIIMPIDGDSYHLRVEVGPLGIDRANWFNRGEAAQQRIWGGDRPLLTKADYLPASLPPPPPERAMNQPPPEPPPSTPAPQTPPISRFSGPNPA